MKEYHRKEYHRKEDRRKEDHRKEEQKKEDQIRGKIRSEERRSEEWIEKKRVERSPVYGKGNALPDGEGWRFHERRMHGLELRTNNGLDVAEIHESNVHLRLQRIQVFTWSKGKEHIYLHSTFLFLSFFCFRLHLRIGTHHRRP